MITLTRRLRRDAGVDSNDGTIDRSTNRISIRDKLLVKEVQEMEQMLPSTCRVKFENPNHLHEFKLTISPDEGFWQGGHFIFHVYISEAYNMEVSWMISDQVSSYSSKNRQLKPLSNLNTDQYWNKFWK